MKSIRIGAGLGFYGDHWEPVVASIERGGVQFIASDHLAELTLAILQKDRQRDPSLGYARDVVPMLLRLWPLMQARGVRFVCNAGGLNPMGAAQAVLAAFAAKGWSARIAVIVAALYLVSPIDFVTDALPVLGWIDDGVVVLLLFKLAAKLLPPELAAALRAKVDQRRPATR